MVRFARLLMEYVVLADLALFRFRSNSLRRSAEIEIRRLFARNSRSSAFRIASRERALRWMNEHAVRIALSAFAIVSFGCALPYLPSYPVAQFDIAPDVKIDVSSFHSISTTIQATVLALIIPIAVVLYEFVLAGRRLGRDSTSYFLRGTNVRLITASSVAYLAWVALFEIVAALADVELHPPGAALEAIWLLFNLLLIGQFILKAYRMLDRADFDAEIVGRLFSELFPRELVGDLVTNRYLSLAREDSGSRLDDAAPRIWMWGSGDEAAQVSSEDHGTSELYDVDTKLLLQFFKIWKLRNPGLGEGAGGRQDGPRLNVRPMIGDISDGPVALIATRNSKPLTAIERWAVRRAFRFRPSTKQEEAESRETLDLLATNSVAALDGRDYDSFAETVRFLVDLHGRLLAAAETSDDLGRPINYATLEKGLLVGQVFESWDDAYWRIFEASVRHLDTERRAFGLASTIGHALAISVMRLPSQTSITRVVSVQARLAYALSAWWENQADSQGHLRGPENPCVLSPPASTLYLRSSRTMAAGWDRLLVSALLPNARPTASWEECGSLSSPLLEHLLSTAGFVAKCVVEGDRDGAIFWSHELLRWRRVVDDFAVDSNAIWNEAQNALLSTSIFGMDVKDAKSLLGKYEEFGQNKAAAEVLKATLLNLWADVSLTLGAFLLRWTDAGAPSTSLAFEAACVIINGGADDEDEGAPHQKMLDGPAAFVSYFMREAVVRVDPDRYSGVLSSVADRLDGYTNAPMISGRVYSRSGASEEKITATLLLIGATAAPNDLEHAQAVVSRFAPLFSEYSTAGRAKSEADRALERVKSLDAAQYSGHFALLTGVEPAKAAAALADAFARLGLLFQEVSRLAAEAQLGRIRALGISPARVDSFASTMAERAFAPKKASFPLNLFARIEWTAEPLDPFSLTLNGLPKTEVVEAPDIGPPTFERSAGDRLREQVAARITFDIIETAEKESGRLEKHEYGSEVEFAEAFLRVVKASEEELDAPMLMVSRATAPEFLSRWRRASYLREMELPHGIAVGGREKAARDGRAYHVNDVPVFEAATKFEGALLFSRRLLQAVTFRRFENNLPVSVIFTLDADDPLKGTLLAEWQRRLKLEPELRVFRFLPRPTHVPTKLTNKDMEAVRVRAKEIWEQEGRPEGRSAIHWKKALRDLGLGRG